jgi:hypothetical protein
MSHIQLHPEVVKFFKEHANIVNSGDATYMFYSYWLRFEPFASHANVFEVLTFENLPQDLKDMILSERENKKLKQ